MNTEEPSTSPTQADRDEPASEPTSAIEPHQPRGDGMSNRFAGLLKRLIQLAVLSLAVGLLGYYGLPMLRSKLIAPVELNASQIDDLALELAALQARVDDTDARVNAIGDSVESLEQSGQRLEESLVSLETQVAEDGDASAQALRQAALTTRALDIVARGRLYLAQSNFGLARDDLVAARAIFAELEAESQDEALAPAIARLDMAIENLPDYPVVASGDLEIAWQALMSGDVDALGVATAMATVTVTAMATPTPVEVVTAAPSASPSATGGAGAGR